MRSGFVVAVTHGAESDRGLSRRQLAAFPTLRRRRHRRSPATGYVGHKRKRRVEGRGARTGMGFSDCVGRTRLCHVGARR